MNLELSFTEENYLKAVYHLSRDKDSVNTNALSEEMNTSPASVNDMMKKLANKKLIEYKKYKGAMLLPSGKKAALQVIRKHRLWEVFLVEKLKFKWDEVHEIAEQLEHIKSLLLIEKLDKFLDHPNIDPHGDPIPDKYGKVKEIVKVSLDRSPVNGKGILINVGSESPALLQHLDRIGITLGTKIEIKERLAFDGSMCIFVNDETTQFVSREVAKNLMITVIE